MKIPIRLSRHDHPLTLSSGFAFRCFWCKTGGYISNGYHCTECDLWFHKDCGNDISLYDEIFHTSHPEHPLRLEYTTWLTYWCNACKRRIDGESPYHCYTCEDVTLHVSCAREAPPLTINHPQAHEHPLVFFPISRNRKHLCEVCKENVVEKQAYRCFECKVVIHVACENSSGKIHPCHPKHSLNLLTSGAPDYIDKTCLLCDIKLEGVLYHCSMCNFSVCLGCASISPPIDVEHLKTHEHKLTLMARQISFTCDACGMQGDRSPYYCLKCNFMIHRSCIGLPRVININRHEHRLSHTQQLSFGEWVCGVCLQNVNRFYGAYSCSVCIDYFVHSRCATENDVWDGIELEGSLEETKDMPPFKEVGDNLINHFSHNHYLKFSKDGTTHGDGGNIRCEACMLPVYSQPVYSCAQCGFIIHEICANLPPKKQHMLHNKPFTFHIGNMDSPEVLPCTACGELFNGFRYESDHVFLDVRCILISQLFSHDNHEHPLHYNKTYIGKCDACHKSINSGAFSCNSCPYNLDFLCASLPKTVKHTLDEHPLSLSCKNFANWKYWCDICEEEMDPNKWFYTCNDCEVALHVKCVLGDFSRLKPRRVIELDNKEFIVIPNNHSSRPICDACQQRCTAPFVLKSSEDMIFCSQRCAPDFNQMIRALAKALLSATLHRHG